MASTAGAQTVTSRDVDRDITARLARAAGQLTAVQRMQAEQRPCLDLIDQIRAVTAALDAAAVLLAERELSHLQARPSPQAASAAVSVLRRVARRG